MKHKHAELIKKWADGAKIQIKYSKNDDWEDVNPTWNEQFEYRIKPEYNRKGTRMNDLFKPHQCPRCFGLFNIEKKVWNDRGTIYHLTCWINKTKEQNKRGTKMNELIEKLAKQAFGSITDPILVYEAEKFAELIVRECGNVAWKCGSEFINNEIKRHFGVKE